VTDVGAEDRARGKLIQTEPFYFGELKSGPPRTAGSDIDDELNNICFVRAKSFATTVNSFYFAQQFHVDGISPYFFPFDWASTKSLVWLISPVTPGKNNLVHRLIPRVIGYIHAKDWDVETRFLSNDL
jgi:hypothetical protein